MKLGKRFAFATIAILCVSIVTILLKYNGLIYLKLVGAVVGVFTLSQTVTDIRKNNEPK